MGDQEYLKTALCIAARAGDTEKVADLLRRGADAEASGALREAFGAGHRDIMAALVHAGAKASHTMLAQALGAGDRALGRWLANAGARASHDMVLAAVRARDAELIEIMEIAGWSIRSAPLLPIFAGEGDLDAVTYLLARGANPDSEAVTYHDHSNFEDSWTTAVSDTALIAVCNPDRALSPTTRAQILQALLDAGASVNKTGRGFGTPLDVALKYASATGDMTLADVLVAHGGKTSQGLFASATDARGAPGRGSPGCAIVPVALCVLGARLVLCVAQWVCHA